MKNLGILRKVDELGRIVIPSETRKTLRINEGDPLEIFMDGDKIILKKYSTMYCTSCGQAVEECDRYCKDCGRKL